MHRPLLILATILLALGVDLFADTGKKVAPACAFCADCQCPPGKCACKPLAGIWHVAGVEHGKPYAGAVILHESEDAPGIVMLNYAVGLSSSVGVGIRDGDRLSVTWKARDGSGIGATSYRLDPKGKAMHGLWTTLPNDGKVRRETLRFLRKTDDPDA